MWPSRSTIWIGRRVVQRSFGATVEHREVVESDGVEEALLKVAESYIQLLTPTTGSSPVAKYLANKAKGSTTLLPGGGLRRRPPGGQRQRRPGDRRVPRPGSRGTTVAFVHPKTSFGTLIELVQE